MDIFKVRPTKALIHQTGVVVTPINNEINMGRVYINGKEYAASSVNGKEYDIDTPVEVLRVEGNRVFVRKINNQ